ncbi:MAG: LuxR C-terminal-related transcriptional regulator [Caldilineaceae bacterium]
METDFFTTKTQVPPLPHHNVQRRRLTDALESKILHFQLALLNAPAGYGKTTLLTQWAHSTQLSLAWVSLGAEDNEPERFLRLLYVALEAVRPEVRDSDLDLVLGGLSPDPEVALLAFIETVSEATDHFVLILDDYHLITNPHIHEALTTLVDGLPPTIHIVVAGRGEPSLPLARYRARNQVLEFLPEELKFTPEETGEFLNVSKGLALEQDELDALQAQLEGWPTGMQLASLALQRHLVSGSRLVSGGGQRFIADYLSEDVLDPLDVGMQEFLLKTSLLDRLSAPLCDALTGNANGQAMLESLESQGLFVTALDDHREWYRYHRLFADFLTNTLDRRAADEVPDLHRRAAQWYLEHDFSREAFRHALACDDVQLVSEIMDRKFPSMLQSGEVNVLKDWLDSLPGEWRRSHPSIAIAQAGVYLYMGQPEAAQNWLDEIERSAADSSRESELRRTGISAMRCFIACFQNDLAKAEVFADQAMQEISEEHIDLRSGVYGALGDTYRRNGLWQKAQDSYVQLLDFAVAPTFHIEQVHVFGALADLELRQGNLQSAGAYWRRALSAIQTRQNWGLYPLPLIGWVYVRMGELLYERNDLTDAWHHVSQGLERAKLGGDTRTLIAGHLAACRIKLSEADTEMAADYLDRAQHLVAHTQFSDWNSRYERLRIELWLAQGELRQAAGWASAALVTNSRPETLSEPAMSLAIARALIAANNTNSLRQGRALLDDLIVTAKTASRGDIVVEASALQALALTNLGESAEALVVLGEAVRLAQPQGYIRTFVDLGLPMARLLQEANARGIAPDYTASLLSAFDLALASGPGAKQTLPEPLTPRETEVLELISAGLSNREIADYLVIAPGTVKKHTGNIYGKLGVSNRTEAVARARELEILD